MFEWDEEKERRNIRERGISFILAAQVFADEARITVVDSRNEYGEHRFITFGKVAGRLFVVVHTPRGEVTRIISARKANRREQKLFKEWMSGQERYDKD